MDSPRREISLLAVWAFLARHKAVIGPSVLACAIAAAALAFALTPKYRAEVVFSPRNSTGGMAGELGASLGGIAALAGVNIGGGGQGGEGVLEHTRGRVVT